MMNFKNADEFSQYLLKMNNVISHKEIDDIEGSRFILDFYTSVENGEEIFRISLENFTAFEMKVV